jgi:galactonate dehydratase
MEPRILAVRGAIGPDVKLLVDCHWRLSPMMARTILTEAAGARLFWLEVALDEAAFDLAAARPASLCQ